MAHTCASEVGVSMDPPVAGCWSRLSLGVLKSICGAAVELQAAIGPRAQPGGMCARVSHGAPRSGSRACGRVRVGAVRLGVQRTARAPPGATRHRLRPAPAARALSAPRCFSFFLLSSYFLLLQLLMHMHAPAALHVAL
jgi:hypothetical protein